MNLSRSGRFRAPGRIKRRAPLLRNNDIFDRTSRPEHILRSAIIPSAVPPVSSGYGTFRRSFLASRTRPWTFESDRSERSRLALSTCPYPLDFMILVGILVLSARHHSVRRSPTLPLAAKTRSRIRPGRETRQARARRTPRPAAAPQRRLSLPSRTTGIWYFSPFLSGCAMPGATPTP